MKDFRSLTLLWIADHTFHHPSLTLLPPTSQFSGDMFLVSALLTAALAASFNSPHKIKSLPGYIDSKPINFNQYAGLIALPSNGQEMFYWLVESVSNPSLDPLILWLNGGPGCSSLGGGLFTEMGPFVVQNNLSVKRNPYAWNRQANIVYLDSPAGVGFSQPLLNASDYVDDVTAGRTSEFLAQFLTMYPQYAHRDFYITGESYAGMYIPFLVHRLVTHPVPNLKLTGFAIGNPYTDQQIDGNHAMDYYYSHGLISIESYQAIQATCKPSELWQCELQLRGCSDTCNAVYAPASASMLSSLLNPYDIYGDFCYLLANQTSALAYRRAKTIPPPSDSTPYGPCIDVSTATYLNQLSVQKAIHAVPKQGTQPKPWTFCSDVVGTMYQSSLTSLDKYPTILNAGLKAMVYSGDTDSVVPFTGTQMWLQSLALPVTQKWAAWFGPDKQLAGYSETYGNLTFKTVKGAGHMVPTKKPLHALYLLECFVYGSDACAKFTYPKNPVEDVTGASYMQAHTDDRTLALFLSAAAAMALVGAVAIVLKQKVKKQAQYVELTKRTVPTYT
ncbi:Aste57867_11137 [Aphanomyces stellatus]|uniref:Carboxypeptidase n=1 Tax=Aphanomyces stellatus TaxID=120398 RepID=A0A485KTC4_9STRA|nr:hypothetical protein As57867_011095 [Aphanomyces stellatus]VFT88004.1 Aste57867_11137 [Aphanomyces stellatus]